MARWRSPVWSPCASGCALSSSDCPLSLRSASWSASAPARHRSASRCRWDSGCCFPPPWCPLAACAPESLGAVAPNPRSDHATRESSRAQSPAPDEAASFHPALSPCQSGRNSGTPRWRVLPVLQSRNSNCARASGSACAALLPLASAAAPACGSAHAVSLAPGRPLPAVPRPPTIDPPPASTVPTTRPLLRRTNLPTNSAAGAAIGSLVFLLTLVNSTAKQRCSTYPHTCSRKFTAQ